MPGEQGDIFGILFYRAERGYQVPFHLLVQVCSANQATTVNYRMEPYVARSKGGDNALLRSWGIPVATCIFTTKPMLLQLPSASDLFI